MPVDYYPQKTEDELLVMLAAVQKRSTEGAVSMTTMAGMQQMRSWQGSGSVALEIRHILYSLSRRDPVLYADPYISRVRKTRAAYT